MASIACKEALGEFLGAHVSCYPMSGGDSSQVLGSRTEVQNIRFPLPE